MAKVVTGFSTSLDGFIAGPDDDVGRLFRWYFSGDTEVAFPGGMVAMVSPASAEHIRDVHLKIGALVTGRRQFDLTNGWGGRHPLDVPVFVVTHTAPKGWVTEGTPFTFITDGVESAIRQAQTVAGDKHVGVDGANVVSSASGSG